LTSCSGHHRHAVMTPVSLPSLTILKVSLLELFTGCMSKPILHPDLWAQLICTILQSARAQELGDPNLTVCAAGSTLHSCTCVQLANLAFQLESLRRDRSDTLDDLHRLGIREHDLRSPDSTDDVSPVVALRLLQRLSRLRLVLFGVLNLAAIELGGLLVELVLCGFLLV
jgi:hypothetical protein